MSDSGIGLIGVALPVEPRPKFSADGALMVFVWTVVAVTIGRVGADPDLWGNLRFGLDVLRDRGLPTHDPYSFTGDIPWINHEWFSELQMAVVYRGAGIPGLIALKVVLTAIAFAVLAWATRRLPILLRGALTLIVMWAASPIATTMRPQMWSFALTGILASLLMSERPSRQLWWIPPMFAVWVNMHGGWVVGAGLLGVWGAAGIFDPVWRRWVLAVGIATLLATLLNPYGVEMWTFLLKTVRLQRDIREWRSISTAPFGDWWPWLLASGTFAGLLFAHCRLGFQRVVTLTPLAYASFRVARLVPFFVLVSAIYLARPLAEFAERHPSLRWRLVAPSRLGVALALVPSLAVVLMVAPKMWTERASCIPIEGDWVPDPTTAMALQLARPTGRLVTYFGWGHYSIWHFGPALRVSLDGRRETLYSDPVLEEQLGIGQGEPRSLAFLERARPEYVWVQASSSPLLHRWLAEHGYRFDLETTKAWLAVRSDLPVIAQPPAPAPSCFPG